MKSRIKQFIVEYFVPALLVFGIVLAGFMLICDAILARMVGII